MSYQVLSLKWRPKSFDQIIGQDHVTHTLKNAISMDRLAQAFLFTGPRGVGKTTTARVLASTVNKIENYQSSLDIIELDGASNRGIDEIREIRDSVNFPPTSSDYKIYIIDEAHMLTEQAFNALLKTLEEPPPYIIFILATTDPQKLPQTILSRTQRYDFMRLSLETIKNHLEYIIKEENLQAESEAIELIAKKADGSMRDSLSILDQVIAYCSESIDAKSVRAAIGLISDDDMEELFKFISQGNISESIEKLNSIFNLGVSVKNFSDNLISFLDEAILNSVNKQEGRFLFSYPDLLSMLNMTLNLSSKLNKLENPRVSVEVLLLNFVNMFGSTGKDNNLDSLIESQKEENSKSDDAIATNSSDDESSNATDNKDQISTNDDAIATNSSDDKSSNATDNKDQISTNDEEIFYNIKSSWKNIIDELDNTNSKLSSFLEEVTLKKVDSGSLNLSLENGNNFIKKVLESDQQIIREAIYKICNIRINISLSVDSIKSKETENHKNIDNEEKNHPLLEDVIKEFKGKVIS